MTTSKQNWQQELSRHRIAAVKTKRVRSRYPRLYGKNAKKSEHGYGGEFLIFEVTTDQGAAGWGLQRRSVPGGINIMNGITFPSSEGLIGQSLTQLFDPFVGTISPDADHLDFALHDLAGRILGIPVYEMLGAAGKTEVPCYDGAIYMDDISPGKIDRGLDIIIENCRTDYAMGFRAFKLKIGRGYQWMDWEDGIKRDIQVTNEVRKHFPDAHIMVDANDGYSVEEFLKYYEAVADCKLFWIEEPFRENREDLLKLREKIAKLSPGTLIADGEAKPDIDELLQLTKESLIDVLLMDIQNYGFTEWRKLMPKVSETNHNTQISPHNWGLRLKTHYSAQFAAGVSGTINLEGLPDEAEGVDFSGYRLQEGMLHVPDKPGFGMNLHWGLELE
jgi:D-galactarolactone cycloisomerase